MNLRNVFVKFLAGFVISITLLIIVFFWITNGKGSCKLCGGVGVSHSIEESKKRGVFIRELEPFKIVPDTLKLTIKKDFYLERGFQYGKYNASKTDSLTDFSRYKYRLGLSPGEGRHTEDPYLLYCKKYQTYPPDTCICEIWTRAPPYDSSYKVGELFLR